MKTIIRNFLSVIRRFKMATLLNVLGLSVAFTAIIIIMMQVLWDLKFDSQDPNTDDIYRVEARFEGRQLGIVPRPLLEGLKAFSPYVEAAAVSSGMEAMNDWPFVVEKGGIRNSFKGNIKSVSFDYMRVFQFDMVEGSIDKIHEPNTVLIPQSLANKVFGEESAIDKQLLNEGQQWTIGGVYKDFPTNSSMQNVIHRKMNDKENNDNWGNFNYAGYVRVSPGTDFQHILDEFCAKKKEESSEQTLGLQVDYKIVPLRDIHFNTHTEFDEVTEKTSYSTIAVLLAIAFVILLIAVINFTNYSIALTPLRIKSINTQKVLGAADENLRKSLVAEAILTCLLAWGVALFFTHLLASSSVSQIISADMTLGGHADILIGTGIIALLVGLIAGVYPAFYMTSFAPALVLKGSFGLSPKGRQLRNALVGVQFVASFALIIVALFMYLQVGFMQRSAMGFDKDRVIVANLNNDVRNSLQTFTNKLKESPAVESVSYAGTLLSGTDIHSTWMREISERKVMFQAIAVGTDFLETMNIPLLEGRNFLPSDKKSDNLFFLFNERAKKDLELSLGDKLSDDGEVIGFIPDLNVTTMRKAIEPMAFYLIGDQDYRIWQNEWAYIKIKAGSDIFKEMEMVQAKLEEISPDYIFNVTFYDDVINYVYMKEQRITSLITWFSLIAVLISLVGVFGLVVFESEYKRKEIGVRKVLGSTTGQILAMFNSRYVKILAICFVIAAPIAWYAVSRWLEGFAYRTPMYWWIYLFSFLLITAITIATVTFQSWRVADANPVDSIKTE
ncbi:ABC transporter permease [Parabacteroides sp. 52]|uniref:ABC transporter permease n=1 Tax=unclassified Parabacteroides TaxID=2649774 RepID=UPI0013D66D93|nr:MULTISPECIES: ABC transporter permease [unclassified Parabacteroides]MDH6534439.1 putative ABC transport system permease protein [Parabacteroides sp. PM5-20]NDV55112.1 ABC transporter permease [Parabacteroides sp. 52]